MTEFPHMNSPDPEDKDGTVSQSTSKNDAEPKAPNEEVNPTEPVELDIADPHFIAKAHELYADLPGGGSGKAAGGGRASRRRIQGNDRELAWPSIPTSGVCQRAAIRRPGCGSAVGHLL